MRRVVLLITSCLLLTAVGGCKSDGRVLRPARDDQSNTMAAFSFW